MSPGSLLRAAYKGLRRALRVLGRPVRRARGLERVVIQPYRGYGTIDEIYLMGRVFRQPTLGSGLPRGTVVRELSDILRRLTRWGLGDVSIRATLDGATGEFVTDRDGYFHIDLPLAGRGSSEPGWHAVDLAVTRDGQTVHEEGLVYLAPPSARQVVVSDIDDTVMFTGVANRARMLWNLFVRSAESRVAFPGVAALYRGFHEGPGGDEGNPMLYVSRAPWSIYEVLEAFFRLQKIPDGPILFLREWGLTLQRPLPRRAEDHKHDLIEGMLRRYSELPFILVGDSGQHDPEVYADLVRRYPGRIRAVYIRDVTGSDARGGQSAALAAETAEAGCPLVLAGDSATMAAHAVEHGFLREDVLDAVRAERRDLQAADG